MKRLVLALALFAGAAHAEFKDGNELLADMNSKNYFNQGVALGYVMGVTDAQAGVSHCSPANVTAGQVHDMVKKTMEDMPSVRHLSADVIIRGVLKNTWPCEKKKGGAL